MKIIERKRTGKDEDMGQCIGGRRLVKQCTGLRRRLRCNWLPMILQVCKNASFAQLSSPLIPNRLTNSERRRDRVQGLDAGSDYDTELRRPP